jgi:hypothetical protein
MRSNVGEVIAVGRNMEWGTEGMGLYECSVPVQTLQSLTVSKAKEVSSAEHRSHSPGMH